MSRRDEWIVRLFQAGGMVIFLSGFVFYKWAILISIVFTLYMILGWMRIDSWAGYKSYVQSRKQQESTEGEAEQDF